MPLKRFFFKLDNFLKTVLILYVVTPDSVFSPTIANFEQFKCVTKQNISLADISLVCLLKHVNIGKIV